VSSCPDEVRRVAVGPPLAWQGSNSLVASFVSDRLSGSRQPNQDLLIHPVVLLAQSAIVAARCNSIC
jgi:hypothetical protein